MKRAVSRYPDVFSFRWLEINGVRVLELVNRKPEDTRVDGLTMIAAGHGHSSKSKGACSIDRSRVEKESFVRVLALVQGMNGGREACDAARELSDWMHVNVRVETSWETDRPAREPGEPDPG